MHLRVSDQQQPILSHVLQKHNETYYEQRKILLRTLTISGVVLEQLTLLDVCLQAHFFYPRPCLCLVPHLPRLALVS